eukprot:3842884-Rhodomonas_salina.1
MGLGSLTDGPRSRDGRCEVTCLTDGARLRDWWRDVTSRDCDVVGHVTDLEVDGSLEPLAELSHLTLLQLVQTYSSSVQPVSNWYKCAHRQYQSFLTGTNVHVVSGTHLTLLQLLHTNSSSDQGGN